MTDDYIYKGAEAEIVPSTYLGKPVILKKRISKSYRIADIDQQLISSRTKEEAKLIAAARQHGVCVPMLYDIDIHQGILTMEYINGERIKDILNTMDQSTRTDICTTIGHHIAQLHAADIIPVSYTHLTLPTN